MHDGRASPPFLRMLIICEPPDLLYLALFIVALAPNEVGEMRVIAVSMPSTSKGQCVCMVEMRITKKTRVSARSKMVSFPRGLYPARQIFRKLSIIASCTLVCRETRKESIYM